MGVVRCRRQRFSTCELSVVPCDQADEAQGACGVGSAFQLRLVVCIMYAVSIEFTVQTEKYLGETAKSNENNSTKAPVAKCCYCSILGVEREMPAEHCRSCAVCEVPEVNKASRRSSRVAELHARD
jgi:hypothetical protein